MKAPGITLRVAVALFCCTTPSWPETREPAQQPSVLLVTLDTTRADHLGCYGAKTASTPHLDRLAGEGVRFDDALSPTPLTLPSHTTIFTGMVPRRHGVRDNALFRLGDRPETLPALLRDNGYRTAAFVSSVVLDRITGLDRGFEHYDDTVRIGPRESFDYRERAAIQTTDAALEYLTGVDEPFFLWVHYFDPHLPYVPPDPFRERFAHRPYDGEIAFMDQQFGRLLKAVRAKSASLVVAVAGDHGESLGEHGEQAHGVFIYRATQRVPLLLAGAEVPRGKVVARTVGLVDLAPTLLDLLGLAALRDTDGRSLLPLLRGEARGTRAYEMESLYGRHAYGWAPLHGLRRGSFKFVLAPKDELYRLNDDPGEIENLATERPKRAAELSRELRALVGDDGTGPVTDDPALAEQRRRLESLGYVSGGSASSEDTTIDPKDGITWLADLETGRRAYQTGKPAEGIEPLRRLLQRNPGNVPAMLALGVCYLGTGEAQKAVQTNRRALEIRRDDELVQFNLANSLVAASGQRAEAVREAREHYDRALELNPRFADAYLNYASLLEKTGAEGEALALLQRARSSGVRDPDLEIRMAVLELKSGRVERAKEALRRALELHPGATRAQEALTRIEELERDD